MLRTRIIAFIGLLITTSFAQALDERALDNALKTLVSYADGRISEMQLEALAQQNHLITELRWAQNAHFMVEIAAEVNKKSIAEPVKKMIVENLKISETIFESKQQIQSSTRDPSHINNVDVLFKGIAERTTLSRKIFEGDMAIDWDDEKGDDPRDALIFKKVETVLFMTNPDGKCGDYNLGFYNRAETKENLQKILEREPVFKGIFAKFLTKSQEPWLEEDVMKALAKQKNKDCCFWRLRRNQTKNLLDYREKNTLYNSNPEQKGNKVIHIFTDGDIHFSKLVPIDDLMEMIYGKIHENRFNLNTRYDQNNKQKNMMQYLRNWIK